MKFLGKLLIVFMIISVLSGCVSTQRYAGPPLPLSKIAVIRSGDDTKIRAIDSQWTGISQSRYELLPGFHVIRVVPVIIPVVPGTMITTGSLNLSFIAEAGHEYLVQAVISPDQTKWGAYIFDERSLKIVSIPYLKG